MEVCGRWTSIHVYQSTYLCTEGEIKVLFCQGESEFFCDVCLLRDVQSATNRLSDRSLNDV